jgi:hypothetical protein
MPHPRRLPIVLGCLLVFALLAGPAARPAEARVSAVGLLDYTKQNFKVGDWVRYKVELSNSKGFEDVNLQEVRIVGEETYRGERCFWVETWYGPNEMSASFDLALVSYDVFEDVAPDVHYRNYLRLVLLGLDDEGVPEMNDLQRSNPNAPPPDLRPYRGQVDTLGIEAVETPKGKIEGRHLRITRRLSRTHPEADSTVNRITDTVRDNWINRKVPVTSLVREVEVSTRKIQSYKVGTPSTDAPETIDESLNRSAIAVEWGTGATSSLLEQWREKRGLLRAKGAAGMGLEDEAPPD